MKHIYIHIPFCIKKCNYCNFYSITDLSLMDDFVSALTDEINHFAKIYGSSQIETVYLGGGTPSILSIDHFEKFGHGAIWDGAICSVTEFSIEVNPETFDKDKLIKFKEAGINRISVGIQSFNDTCLRYLGRVHTAERGRKALKQALELFENVSIDLIFGLPGQSINDIADDIKMASDFSPKHISVYELTFEEGTPLYKDAKLLEGDDGKAYRLVKTSLEDAGYRQYEISNYALPGYECRHSLAYWSDKSYLGFGPSAHSYDRETMKRWANKRSITDYIGGNRLDFTEDAQSIDRIIMGLRRTAGMEASIIPGEYRGAISKLINDGLLESRAGKIAYSEKGLLLSNRVLLEIMGNAPISTVDCRVT